MRADPDHDAVCLEEGNHLLVVAPPGTGKTFLSVRLARIIAPTLQPFERVLLLTFSNQARMQLEREAVKRLSADTRRRVEIANYHGFFRREVWGHRRALGLPLDLRIGSFRRRLEALQVVDAAVVRQLRQNGLLEALAEHGFERFRDDRTPEIGMLNRLLTAVTQEQRAGRLVFDDLGALFWTLLEQYPVLDRAYRARYPVVIADEHQDASELQDAVVRRLGSKRLVILADPMQLIYSFRGSRPERLQRHVDEAVRRFELRTPHRWHGDHLSGNWLLAVRRRLSGENATAAAPMSLEVVKFRYPGEMKARTKERVVQAFQNGMATVAVLCFTNGDVANLRDYLSKQGMYPRQIGGDDFEEAQEDIEQLPLLNERQDVALRAVERIETLVPTLETNLLRTIKGRIGRDGINLVGRLGPEAKTLLQALLPLFGQGPERYFSCIATMLDACAACGHHLPRIHAVRSLRETAATSMDSNIELNAVISRYAETVAAASQTAPRYQKGLFVMTAHQAKGKEFDAVVIVNAAERYLPDRDEERRLFYVAITRATKRWVVIVPQEKPSPLLRHL